MATRPSVSQPKIFAFGQRKVEGFATQANKLSAQQSRQNVGKIHCRFFDKKEGNLRRREPPEATGSLGSVQQPRPSLRRIRSPCGLIARGVFLRRRTKGSVGGNRVDSSYKRRYDVYSLRPALYAGSINTEESERCN